MHTRALALILFLIAPLLVTSAVAAPGVVEWEYSFVNMRSAPSTGAKKLMRIPEGTEINIVQDKGEWLMIGYKGKQGWVVSRAIEKIAPPVAPKAASEESVAAPELEAKAPDPTPVAKTPEKIEAVTVAAKDPEPMAPAPPAETTTVEPPVKASTPAPKSEVEAPEKAQPQSPAGYLSDVSTRTEAPELDLSTSIFDMFVGLLVVLGLIGGIAWFVRRFMSGRIPGAQGNSAIRVLTTRPLGPRQALLLVDVGGEAYLLAQSEGGVDLLSKIESPEALERLDYLFEFRAKPFEGELRKKLDLESEVAAAVEQEVVEADEEKVSPEERLDMLRRGPNSPESK